MATMNLYIRAQVVSPGSSINIDASAESICNQSYNLTIDPGYVEFIPNGSNVSITPPANVEITEPTSFTVVINTYKAVSGSFNNSYSSFTLNLRSESGGAIIDTLSKDRYSTGNPCRDLEFEDS